MTAASVTAAALCVLATLALASAEDLQVPALQSPEGPPQFCRDDAVPPWNDDGETYPGVREAQEEAGERMRALQKPPRGSWSGVLGNLVPALVLLLALSHFLTE